MEGITKEKIANYMMLFFIFSEIFLLVIIRYQDVTLYNDMIDTNKFFIMIVLNIISIVKSREFIRNKEFKIFCFVQSIVFIVIIGLWFFFKPNYTYEEAVKIITKDKKETYGIEKLSEKNYILEYYYIIDINTDDNYYYEFHPSEGLYTKRNIN
ncbi:hypothetical protein [Wukongibacter sp. M2B1]|uniref:hypothetical protein n=1 Tax=Wukongibacter sp. M2B1 TaxID=3088895 RepID=UPI003D797CC0